jgi:hypothetical protein
MASVKAAAPPVDVSDAMLAVMLTLLSVTLDGWEPMGACSMKAAPKVALLATNEQLLTRIT